MVTMVCGTKPDLNVRRRLVGSKRIWSTTGQVQFAGRLFLRAPKPRELIRSLHPEQWATSEGSKKIGTLVRSHISCMFVCAVIYVFRHCAILMIKKKRKKKERRIENQKDKTKSWVFQSSQLQQVEWTVLIGPGERGEVLQNERRLPPKLQC